MTREMPRMLFTTWTAKSYVMKGRRFFKNLMGNVNKLGYLTYFLSVCLVSKHFCIFRVTIEHARVRLRGGRGRRAGGSVGRFSDRYGRGSQSSRR